MAKRYKIKSVAVVVPSIVGAMYYMGFGDETEEKTDEEKQNERGR